MIRKLMTTLAVVGICAAATTALADVTVMAVRLGAKDVEALAKFYETALGLKEIDRIGRPPNEIIMRHGATVAAAKAGSSPEFLLVKRSGSMDGDAVPHAVFRVTDIAATVAVAKKAGATMKGEIAPAKVGSTDLKFALLADPDGNVIELVELRKGVEQLKHP